MTHKLRAEILAYIHGRVEAGMLPNLKQTRIWADEEERKEMEICHPRSIEILKQFLGSISPRSLFRALDVAGGDGRLASDFLLKQYRKVDIFDQCPEAVQRARRKM